MLVAVLIMELVNVFTMRTIGFPYAIILFVGVAPGRWVGSTFKYQNSSINDDPFRY